ncbi:MAG: NADH-quinone oxidoreductase subunit H [Candidatus Riflebacteria bacterium]|nr:NADH-quinone oxidoreductase subunit H [Candidatus Riflebacteria bacterium]
MQPVTASVGAPDLKDRLDVLLTYLPSFLSSHGEIVSAVFLLIVALAVLLGVSVYVCLAVWLERKISADMQDRLGPMRVGWHGVVQMLVDPVKLALKEDLCPGAADRPFFMLAPFVVLAASFATFAVMPFSAAFILADLDIGVLYVASVGAGVLVGLVMAGWASNNKWALFSAIRTIAMLVSYEIPVGLSIVTVVMMVGSLSTQKIVLAQLSDAGMAGWHLFRFPPVFMVSFLVFFIAGLAEVNRTPFDLAEADSELVAGFHTEYSGMRWSFFFLAEYADMLIVSMLGTVLYLGGWAPLTVTRPLTIDFWVFWGMAALLAWYLHWLWTRIYLPRGEYGLIVVQTAILIAIALALLVVPSLAWFLIKSLALIFVMMWLRWTLPRPRIDQLMYLCWKVLIPVAFVNLFVVGVMRLYWR